MSKPMKQHTVDSLYQRTDEFGECRIWKGYFVNDTPMVYHNGRMYSVRKLLLELSGLSATGSFFGCTCGQSGCVTIEHIAKRRMQDHLKLMTKNSAKVASNPIRCAKISMARRKDSKLSQADIEEIMLSRESGPELANKYGVTRSRISQVRNKVQPGNIWGGLIR